MVAVKEPSWQVWEYVTEEAERSGTPRWTNTFLVEEGDDDVFMPGPWLTMLEIFQYTALGELLIFPADPRHAHLQGKPFVSAKALAREDPKFDVIRLKILKAFDEHEAETAKGKGKRRRPKPRRRPRSG